MLQNNKTDSDSYFAKNLLIQKLTYKQIQYIKQQQEKQKAAFP